MLSVPQALSVYLAVSHIDMRKSFDGMSVYIQCCLKMNPLKDGVFVFRNKSGDKVKLIYWNRTGLVIVYKRLEQGRFKWSSPDENVMRLSRQELELLLDSVDLAKVSRFPSLHFDSV